MRPIRSYSTHHPLLKLLATIAICALATLAALGFEALPDRFTPLGAVNWLCYDFLFRLRPPEPKPDGKVVILLVDDASLKNIAQDYDLVWPWPRETWAHLIRFADRAGAAAVYVDILFSERSVHGREDDQTVADAVRETRIPVIFAVQSNAQGGHRGFVPDIEQPLLGAVNLEDDSSVTRVYHTMIHGLPTPAALVAQRLGHLVAPISADQPFLIHYYGPHVDPPPFEGATTNPRAPTFDQISIARVIKTAISPQMVSPEDRIDPSRLKGRVVLIGGAASGLYDLKATPYDAQYPGAEIHATAIENLLRGDRVRYVGMARYVATTMVVAMLAVLPAVFARRGWLKIFGAVIALLVLIATAVHLFQRTSIQFLPPAAPALAIVVATILGLTWSYVTEGRQRRFLIQAFSRYVSPTVVAELDRDPSALTLGGRRREMTVLFSDIEGFTDLSERLDAARIEALLGIYLTELTRVVLDANGTVDKYIGDSIMAFWNAPLDQPDHALLAVSTALKLIDRERAIQPELERIGGAPVRTRIGLSTGPMTVGNFGAPEKLNYTVVGDAVNLASRLESACRHYGIQILTSEAVVRATADRVLFRRVDVIRGLGFSQPYGVYQPLVLMDSDAPQLGDLRRLASDYERALDHYQSRRWDAAEEILVAISQTFSDDGPTRTLSERVRNFRQHPPPPEWDGVCILDRK